MSTVTGKTAEVSTYRAQAEHCRQLAERAEHDDFGIREKYLELADKWDWLARQAETR